jgi:hypothetical protein
MAPTWQEVAIDAAALQTSPADAMNAGSLVMAGVVALLGKPMVVAFAIIILSMLGLLVHGSEPRLIKAILSYLPEKKEKVSENKTDSWLTGKFQGWLDKRAGDEMPNNKMNAMSRPIRALAIAASSIVATTLTVLICLVGLKFAQHSGKGYAQREISMLKSSWGKQTDYTSIQLILKEDAMAKVPVLETLESESRVPHRVIQLAGSGNAIFVARLVAGKIETFAINRSELVATQATSR